MIKEDIIEKYKDFRLGYRDYEKDDKYVGDFKNFNVVVKWILLMPERYTDLTKEGFMFIDEYHGIDNILKKILEDYPDFPFDGNDPKKYMKEVLTNAVSGKR
ncbi:MAG: hypothetical protein WC465_04540 [Patescibacteria group bacterium]